MRRAVAFLIFLLTAVSLSAAEMKQTLLDRLASQIPSERFELRGEGFVTDASHPKRPGDFHRETITFRILLDPPAGDALLELTSAGEKPTTDRYFVRRGAVFQLNEKLEEMPASDFGDISVATLAALNPWLVDRAIAMRRENVHVVGDGALLLSWNDTLWRAEIARDTKLAKLHRRVFHPVGGDREEEIRYESWRPVGNVTLPRRITVVSGGRDVGVFNVTAAAATAERVPLPLEKENHHARVPAADDITFRELAANIFALELVATNSRVFIAEFKDHVAVIEGAYSSQNGDLLARKIRERFQKPIRYFAFSHLHGQYVGGTRSFVHSGASVIVPPTTVPLIKEVVAASHALRPDALSRDPQKLRTESVEKKKVLSDETNTLEIYNIESDHTDEYLIFYFPKQKVLFTGDLLFYRGPDQPLRGRSLKLCTTLANLGLDVKTMYVSWPLEGYGVRNTVTVDEFRDACARSAK